MGGIMYFKEDEPFQIITPSKEYNDIPENWY